MNRLIWQIAQVAFLCGVVALILGPAFVSSQESPRDRVPVMQFVERGATYPLSNYFPAAKDPVLASMLIFTSTTPDAFMIDVEHDKITFLQPGVPSLCDMVSRHCRVFAVEAPIVE